MKRVAAAPLAAQAEKPITPVMLAYVEWLKSETGYDVDPMSVQLSGQLRAQWQKSAFNQARIAEAAERATAKIKAKAERLAQRADAAALNGEKPATTKGSTIATAEGVVIAETRHVEAKPPTPRRRRAASNTKAVSE